MARPCVGLSYSLQYGIFLVNEWVTELVLVFSSGNHFIRSCRSGMSVGRGVWDLATSSC